MALGDKTVFDRHVMAKLEVTKGTDSVPTAAADSIRVNSVTVAKNQQNVDQTKVKQTMGNMKHIPDPDALVTAEIVVDLKGSGSLGVAPDAGVLFLGCRMLETI
ncbi:hypothetical protein KAR91_09605, partial [Candidatus Pacearchaeota archaeon]|nr:hypothetical protein [Candidatus Pacearchaeota archaeon]